MNDIVCYFDGAINPNPHGDMGMGSIINIDNNCHQYFYGINAKIGNSNNVAEYLALTYILEYLLGINIENRTIIIYGDSDMVCRQINGEWGVKAKRKNTSMYYHFAVKAVSLFDRLKEKNDIKLVWIPREQNTNADKLSKKGIMSLYKKTIFNNSSDQDKPRNH